MARARRVDVGVDMGATGTAAAGLTPRGDLMQSKRRVAAPVESDTSHVRFLGTAKKRVPTAAQPPASVALPKADETPPSPSMSKQISAEMLKRDGSFKMFDAKVRVSRPDSEGALATLVGGGADTPRSRGGRGRAYTPRDLSGGIIPQIDAKAYSQMPTPRSGRCRANTP